MSSFNPSANAQALLGGISVGQQRRAQDQEAAYRQQMLAQRIAEVQAQAQREQAEAEANRRLNVMRYRNLGLGAGGMPPTGPMGPPAAGGRGGTPMPDPDLDAFAGADPRFQQHFLDQFERGMRTDEERRYKRDEETRKTREAQAKAQADLEHLRKSGLVKRVPIAKRLELFQAAGVAPTPEEFPEDPTITGEMVAGVRGGDPNAIAQYQNAGGTALSTLLPRPGTDVDPLERLTTFQEIIAGYGGPGVFHPGGLRALQDVYMRGDRVTEGDWKRALIDRTGEGKGRTLAAKYEYEDAVREWTAANQAAKQAVATGDMTPQQAQAMLSQAKMRKDAALANLVGAAMGGPAEEPAAPGDAEVSDEDIDAAIDQLGDAASDEDIAALAQELARRRMKP